MEKHQNQQTILITGSKGLIGSQLSTILRQLGINCRGFDIAYSETDPDYGDICQFDMLAKAVKGVSGIVHLAAVSRVIWGEQDPKKCRSINITGTKNVLNAAYYARSKPWVLYASSREVYGQQETLPVTEDAILKPCNVYADSKVAAESLVNDYKAKGLIASILRFSNVYGSTADHVDRVIPAFCRNAILGNQLKVEGGDHLFDFTYVNDVADGIAHAIQTISQEKALPTLHFTSGIGTTLNQLAALIIKLADSSSSIVPSTPRNFDVAYFVGSPKRTQSVLGWQAQTSLSDGLQHLINTYTKTLLSKTIRALP